ncbi:MAG: hypothetical protein JSS40_03965 [Proteobacteria bacterium]|nr:hypothetical protein [Pseudomonadota bacterium]
MREQKVYADWLDAGTHIGFVILLVTFCVYASGLAAPQIPLADLPKYWGLPIDRYLAATGAPVGWGWVAYAARGDYMNFIGIAFLGTITVACYLRLVVVLAVQRDWLYTAVAVIELAILATSASGFISRGH